MFPCWQSLILSSGPLPLCHCLQIPTLYKNSSHYLLGSILPLHLTTVLCKGNKHGHRCCGLEPQRLFWGAQSTGNRHQGQESVEIL